MRVRGQQLLPQDKWTEFWNTADPLDQHQAAKLVNLLGEVVKEHSEKRRIARITTWRDWMHSSWKNDRGAVYKWLKNKSNKPIVMVERSNGTYTSNIQEIDRECREQWAPITQLYKDGDEPPWEAFHNEYKAYIKGDRMVHRDMTLSNLNTTIGKLRGSSASGPDGWRPAELKALPDPIREVLVNVLNCIEQQGDWPESTMISAVSLLSKGK
eukprot:gene1954-4574_t